MSKFRLTTRMRSFYISVIHLSLTSDFREDLGVELGLGLIFHTGMLFEDQQNMLIQEHVLVGKI